jgi:thymidylate kinase
LIIDANELQKSLADVERFVTSSDAEALRSAGMTWRIPAKVVKKFVEVGESLIAFRPSPRAGKFLVISGVDKSGKETHSFNQSRLAKITSVYDHLNSDGFKVLPINLPSYETLLGSMVGAYLGRRDSGVEIRGELSPSFAWLLWSLDRAQFNRKVDGWLAEGPRNIVLAKRWTESHAVYQPEVGVDRGRVITFEGRIVKQDFTVVLDISPAQALLRLRSRSDRDNYEHASLIERVRHRYLTLSEIYPYGDVYLVDASRSLEEVNSDILSLVDRILQVDGNE